MTEREDDVLDREIDAAASQLTDGSPRPGFPHRVRSRIETRRPTAAWAWRAAAAAVALVLVAYLAVPRHPSEAPEGTVAREPEAGASPAVRAPEVTPPSAPEDSPEAVGRARSGLRPGSVTAARVVPPRLPVNGDAPQIAALIEPTPLVVRVEGPAALDTEGEIELKDIAVQDLSIAPLDPEKEPR
ncbi:MAG TPA: hypothetical protein VK886_17315 [Vicinamibacterales bacterium]|nr:hypothetical protein [Vicinamibacterales bacterium]